MPLFYFLEQLLKYSSYLSVTLILFAITELSLRASWPKASAPPRFYSLSLLVATLTLITFLIFEKLKWSDFLQSLFGPSSSYMLLAAFIYFGVPLAIGTLAGYFISYYKNHQILKQHKNRILILSAFTSWIITTFLAPIMFMVIFLSASDLGGQRILRQTYHDFHYFNQHVRNLCLNATCAKDLSEIKVFNPKRFRYLDFFTTIKYQTDGQHQYYFSVKFNPGRVMISTHETDLLVMTEKEAREQNLWGDN